MWLNSLFLHISGRTFTCVVVWIIWITSTSFIWWRIASGNCKHLIKRKTFNRSCLPKIKATKYIEMYLKTSSELTISEFLWFSSTWQIPIVHSVLNTLPVNNYSTIFLRHTEKIIFPIYIHADPYMYMYIYKYVYVQICICIVSHS